MEIEPRQEYKWERISGRKVTKIWYSRQVEKEGTELMSRTMSGHGENVETLPDLQMYVTGGETDYVSSYVR